MEEKKCTISILPVKLAICYLDKGALIPFWAVKNNLFFSVTMTGDELSIVCPEENIPEQIEKEEGWRAIKVEGKLDFSMSGVLNYLLNPLAKANICVCAISTFKTNYILVKEESLEKAIEALSIFCKVNYL